ncbi:hypothetical protein GCM10027168_48890 [Streptomyces capparidis]
MHLKRRWQSVVAASALVAGSAITALAGPAAAPAGAAGSLDNPYVGAKAYVNPDWSAKAAAEPGGSAIANQPTFVWMDRIAAINGVNGAKGLKAHLDTAKAQGANMIQVVIYDLPGRDCAALASAGELKAHEIDRYKTEYIDPIVKIMSDPAYADLRIVNLIEPDSLPNLVTNAGSEAGSTEACRTMKANGNYVKGVGYALNKLGDLPNTYNYIDAAHHGWLGWDTNFSPFAQQAKEAATAEGATVDDVTGFITNTANYSALREPHFSVTDSINGTTVRQSKWLDWNMYADELSFAQALRNEMVKAGFRSNIGMLIDTARNGWGGPDRPSGPAAKTTVDAYIDGSRVDRRLHPGNWCNQVGAGIGERPTTAPEPGIDAYVWAKPPGESDGSSKPIDNDEGKGFDRMCDPTYEGNARNGFNKPGAMDNSPLAGHWFSAHFRMLLANAYPPIDGGGGPGDDTTAPSIPSSLRVSGTTASSVSLSWGAATDNVGVTGYVVYRNGTQVGTSTTTSFTDSGLTASTAYTYTVRARDAAGNTSAASAAVTGTTTAGNGGGNGCTATYKVDNDWGSGFTATVTVSNTGTARTSGWTVTWTWAGNQQVSNSWNGTATQSGKVVTAKNAGHNGALNTGSSTSFGFQGTYSGSNAAPTPTCTTS